MFSHKRVTEFTCSIVTSARCAVAFLPLVPRSYPHAQAEPDFPQLSLGILLSDGVFAATSVRFGVAALLRRSI